MNGPLNPSRRQLLRTLLAGASLASLAGPAARSAFAADPMVAPGDATATSVKYVSDASQSKDAKPGSHCGNCMLYQGAAGSASGGCPIFPGKQVSSKGWCLSWTAKS